MNKTGLLWLVAILITIASAYYQRVTGPTHPQTNSFELNGEKVKLKFIRTNVDLKDAEIKFKIADSTVAVELFYRLYPSNKEEWIQQDFVRQNEFLVSSLPKQPSSGKIEYFVKIMQNNIPIYTNSENPVIIRFKGDVPTIILIFHVLFMFSAMLFSSLAGLLALFKEQKAKLFVFITLGLLTFGGMILGPIVQKYAFGEFWTGIPKGWDLTDNKTLIAYVFWLIASLLSYKRPNYLWIIIAAIMTLIIFSIPHSFFGSTLNRETGEVVQGILYLPMMLFLNPKFKNK
jgi:hypothetical protein